MLAVMTAVKALSQLQLLFSYVWLVQFHKASCCMLREQGNCPCPPQPHSSSWSTSHPCLFITCEEGAAADFDAVAMCLHVLHHATLRLRQCASQWATGKRGIYCIPTWGQSYSAAPAQTAHHDPRITNDAVVAAW
jgi:hypothetical protein